MTRKRNRAVVGELPHVNDGQPETFQEWPEPTPTPEAAHLQYTNEGQNTPREPKHLPGLCEKHAETVYAERLRSNNDVFAPLRESTAQIRLLQLDAESTEEHITASLQTWERSSLPEFKAISYVCGEALPQNAVCINGREFYVGDNCFYALGQVCLHYPGSYVWIDAICINQQDLAEKSAQVSAMGGIYKLSLRVLACIGPSDAASDEVVRATKDVDSFVQDPPVEWYEADAYRRPCLWEPPFWNPPMDEDSTLELWEDFTEFERRPYFHRAWIVQELVGGKGRTTILCGQSQICWTALCTLADRLCMISESDHAPCNLAETRHTDLVVFDLNELTTNSESGGFTFPRYLEQMAGKDCQDPRDRFFGTMDLVDWQSLGQTRPIPDYHITPLELAFNLLQRTLDPMLDDVFFISQSLGLHNKSQPFSDIERKRSQHNARRGYVSPLSGVHIVEQGADGRLNVGLHHNGSRTTHSFDGIEHDPTFLNEHKVVQLFTGDNPSVLASDGVRAGDLLVDVHLGALLLRYCEDQACLLVVGAALLAARYSSHNGWDPPAGCVCWKTVQRARDGHAVVSLRLELPDTVALGSVIALSDQRDFYDRGLVLSYLNRYAFGAVMAHSGLGSPPTSYTKGKYTLRSRSAGRSLRKPCANCKKTGNPFWYFLEPDEEGIVSFGH